MNLFEDKRVAPLFETAQEMIDLHQKSPDDLRIAVESKVKLWKFASDEFYNPIPLQSELGLSKKGRLLKIISDKPVFDSKVHSFGFDDDGRLLITYYLIGPGIDFGINTKIYTWTDSMIVYYNMRYYPKNTSANKLMSCGILTCNDDDFKIDILLSTSKNKSLTIFTYDNDRIQEIERFATGWNGKTIYIPKYDEKGMSEIKIGDAVWWKRIKDNK